MTGKGKAKVVATKGKAPAGKRKRGGNDDGKTGGVRERNRSVVQFFEDGAGIDESEESQDSDDSDFRNDEDFRNAPTMMKEPTVANNFPIFPKEEVMDEEEFDKLMEERYGEGSGFVRHAGDEDEFDDKIIEPSFLQTDPTIWRVKCAVGRERHSAFCLMQKFVDLKPLGTKLSIISAFSVDHMKGFIYIEAEKQSDIHEACKGLSSIYVTRVQLVPKNEVSHLFSARSRCNEVFEGMWARVKSGQYKGDLAQVVVVNNARAKVTVKLVPRINLKAMAAKFGGGYGLQKTAVPAPRLISASELEEFRPLMQIRRDRDTGKVFEFLDGMMLKDGYLYKKVSMDSLNFWGDPPREEELLKFSSSEVNETNDLEWLSQLYGQPKRKSVIRGDKGGGKGEGSSRSGVVFELYDLVCFGKKDFGLIIGIEKDETYKILKESQEGSVAVTVDRRDIKSGLYDMKLIAQDKHNKAILANDIVRIQEGPSKGRQGIVKHIYRGIVFLYDENGEENGGYFTCKSHMCEKIKLSVGEYSGKDGEPGPSFLEDIPSSPKFPQSPKQPWQARESGCEFKNGDGDSLFKIGQTLRIRVGPLKGYLCRVIATRRSDVTVKLDSQQKVLTVKSEHLSEVQGKSLSTSGGPNSSSTLFDILGTEGSSGIGWLSGVGTSAGNDGWRKSSWSNPSASSFLQPGSIGNPVSTEDNDQGVGDTSWEIKSTMNQNSSWGAAVDNGVATNPDQPGGWGKGGGCWGEAKSKIEGTSDHLADENHNSEWKNNANNVDGNHHSGWDSKINWNTTETSKERSSGWNQKSDGNRKEGEQNGQCSWNSGKIPEESSAATWNQGNGRKSGSDNGNNLNSAWGVWKSGTSGGKEVEKPADTSNDSAASWGKENGSTSQGCWDKSKEPISSQENHCGWNQKSRRDDTVGKGGDIDGWNSGKTSDGSDVGSRKASDWKKGLNGRENQGGSTTGWGGNPSWKGGLNGGAKEGSKWGTSNPGLSGIAENQATHWQQEANNWNSKLINSGDTQDSKWDKKINLVSGPSDTKEDQDNDQDGWSRRKTHDKIPGTGWGESSSRNNRSNDGRNWGTKKSDIAPPTDSGESQGNGWGQWSNSKSASNYTEAKNLNVSNENISGRDSSTGWGQGGSWKKESGDKQASNLDTWKSGWSSGNESSGRIDSRNQDSSWHKKSNWESGHGGNEDSDLNKNINGSSGSGDANENTNGERNSNVSWKSGSSNGNENQNSNWSSGLTDARKEDSTWGKKSNWNAGSSDANENTNWERNNDNSSWKSGQSNRNENHNSHWNSGNADAENEGLAWGKKSSWNSGSGDVNQNKNWGKNSNWHSGNASNDDKLISGNEGRDETSGDRSSGGNGRSGYGGRGGCRGRGGFRGRGERGSFGGRRGDGSFGGRGRSDREGFGGRGRGWRNQSGGWNSRRDSGEDESSGGFGGGGSSNREGFGCRGGSEGGFGGTGHGWRDQSDAWNNRRDSGEDESSGWKNGTNNNEGWKNNNNGSGNWKQEIENKNNWQSGNQGVGSNKQWQGWSSGSSGATSNWNNKPSDQESEAWTNGTDSTNENASAGGNGWSSGGNRSTRWNKSSTTKETNVEDGWKKGPSSNTTSRGWDDHAKGWNTGAGSGNGGGTGGQVPSWGQSSASDKGQSSTSDKGQSSSWNESTDGKGGSNGTDPWNGGASCSWGKKRDGSDKGGW